MMPRSEFEEFKKFVLWQFKELRHELQEARENPNPRPVTGSVGPRPPSRTVGEKEKQGEKGAGRGGEKGQQAEQGHIPSHTQVELRREQSMGRRVLPSLQPPGSPQAKTIGQGVHSAAGAGAAVFFAIGNTAVNAASAAAYSTVNAAGAISDATGNFADMAASAVPFEGMEFADDEEHEQELERKKLKAQETDWENQQIQPVAEYEFAEGAWDAAMFVFDGRLGVGANLMVLLILFAHIVSQVIFMGMIIANFSQPEFGAETVTQMREWRTNVGQSAFWVDRSKNGKSLAQAICDYDLSVGSSSDKITLLKGLYKYWNWTRPAYFISGPSLAAVCILAWVTTCLGEVRKVWKAFYVVAWGIPRGKSVVAGNVSSGFELVTLTDSRRIWIVVLLMSQATVAICVMAVGSVFISTTTSVEQLLLHALAMEIIFTIDERLYSALLPTVVHNLIKRMKPMEMRLGHYRGMDLKTFVLLAATFITVISVVGQYVLPVLWAVQGLQNELCGGNKNFLYTTDSVGMVWVLNEATPPSMNVTISSSIKTVQNIVQNRGAGYQLSSYPFAADTFAGLDVAIAQAGPDYYQQLHNATAKEEVLWCADLVLEAKEAVALADRFPVAAAITKYGPLVGAVSGEGELLESCAAAAPYCWMSPFIRTVCGHTCGCDNPLGGVLQRDIGSRTGCANNACFVKSDFYSSQIASAQCKDTVNVAATQWGAWATEFGNVLLTEAPPPGLAWPCTTSTCGAVFSTLKCGIVSFWRSWASSNLTKTAADLVDPCTGRWGNQVSFVPLTTACPETCGCKVTNTSGCPKACR